MDVMIKVKHKLKTSEYDMTFLLFFARSDQKIQNSDIAKSFLSDGNIMKVTVVQLLYFYVHLRYNLNMTFV
jgi:hypothetical protein